MTDTPAQAPAPALTPRPIEVPPDLAIQELCSSDLGRALWERAQWRVAADVLQRQQMALQARVDELERQKSPGTVAPAEKTAAGG